MCQLKEQVAATEKLKRRLHVYLMTGSFSIKKKFSIFKSAGTLLFCKRGLPGVLPLRNPVWDCVSHRLWSMTDVLMSNFHRLKPHRSSFLS